MTIISWFINRFRRRRPPDPKPVRLTDLPDNCLTTIIGHLPLASQVTVLSVSKHLNALATNVLSMRTSLTLICTAYRLHLLRLVTGSSFTIPHTSKRRANPFDTEQFTLPFDASIEGKDDRLISTTELTSESVRILVNRFPRVKELMVVVDGFEPEILLPVGQMVQAYARRLKKLKIWIDVVLGDDEEEEDMSVISPADSAIFMGLLGSINSCTALRHLLLDSPTTLFTEQQQVNLRILSRLETFSFFTNFNVNILLPSIIEYAQANRRLKSLAICNKLIRSQSIREFQHMHPDFSNKFTALTIFFPNFHELPLHQFCQKFNNLRILQIDQLHVPLANLAFCLAPLKKLVHLTLYIDFFDELTNPLNHIDHRLNRLSVAQLPSVKVLSIEATTRAHSDVHTRLLSWIFPNLFWLRFGRNYAGCTACGYTCSDEVPETDLDRCLKAMVLPLNLSALGKGNWFTQLKGVEVKSQRLVHGHHQSREMVLL